MEKVLIRILASLALLWLCSCGTGRKVVADYSAEEFIFLELQSMQLAKGDCQKAVIDEAFSWQGTPYRYGGHSRKGTDCSGYVMEVYRAAVGIGLPRNSAKQAEVCKKIKKGALRPGDLVFFHTGKKKKINHVGIYIGDNKVIHASSSRGVVVSNLDAPYYKKAFHQGGRIPAFETMLKKESKKRRR